MKAMASNLNITVMDYDSEVSTVSLRGVTIDETNLVAEATKMDNLVAAIDNASLGSIIKDARQFSVTKYAPDPPADPDAQRERKWLVLYYDDNTYEKGSFEIPCADASLLDPDRRGYMLKGVGTVYEALKGAVELFFKSPRGKDVIVYDVKHVGRNI